MLRTRSQHGMAILGSDVFKRQGLLTDKEIVAAHGKR